jgi:hypothetical protein
MDFGHPYSLSGLVDEVAQLERFWEEVVPAIADE